MKFDVKNSPPMKALNVYKKKYPDFWKRIDQLYGDASTKWDKALCYCPVGVGMSYIIGPLGLNNFS